MTLASSVGKAIDSCGSALAQAGFERLARPDGISLRRFIRVSERCQAEVSVYRDKWWSKDGGTIHAEAFCLVNDYQVAISGVSQDWTKPDYSLPLHHFQYGLCRHFAPLQETISSPDDCKRLGDVLLGWLLSHAIPWVLRFEQPEAVESFLEREESFSSLAIYLASSGQLERARASVAQFLARLPRGIEKQLAQFQERGLISAAEADALKLASIQSNTDYQQAVHSWLAEQKSNYAFKRTAGRDFDVS
jgi:hypothetical protein